MRRTAPVAHPPADAAAQGVDPGEGPARRSPADRFRPDLEGLRAVAVTLVLLYHARVPGFGGGYVGVDVFYVLSGFLITGLIVRELRETGTVSLPAFYARRARRLLPAAALVLVVTVVASTLVLPPLLVPEVAADGAAAALYASNVRFALQATDYLVADVAPSPLLHYWSLGVEEQFYLFWPALLLFVASRTRSLGRSLVVATAVVLVISVALSVVLTDAAPPWAFFSLPARAWELAIGALIALGATRLAALPARLATSATWVGLLLVAGSALVIEPTTPFPGWAAFLPVGGAALVILGGLGERPSLSSRLLSIPPARYLGRISYSLYLWHWPLIVLPAAALEARLPMAARIGLVLVAVLAAAASQRWVEEPFRHGRWVGLRPSRNLAAAGALTLAVAASSIVASRAPWVVLGGGATSGGDPATAVGDPDLEADLDEVLGRSALPPPSGDPSPVVARTPGGSVPADLRPPLREARDSLSRIYRDGCMVSYLGTGMGDCTYGDRDSDTVVVLLGDSHIAMWFPAFDRLAAEHGWRIVVLAKAVCPAVDVPIYASKLRRHYTECDTWRAQTMERIGLLRPSLVVISHSHGYTLDTPQGPVAVAKRPQAWYAGLSRSLAALGRVADRVAVIGNSPLNQVDAATCLSRHLDNVLACATPMDRAVPFTRIAAEREIAERLGATFIDPTPWLCPSDPCPVVIGRILVYRDAGHITTVLSAALASRLGALLPRL